MTRETKIGLLTGLGVIVLIGVLLSEYLGKPIETAPRASAMANDGAQYRQNVLQPVGAPPIDGKGLDAAGGPGSLAALPGGEMPVAFKQDQGVQITAPVVAPPVSAEPAGKIEEPAAPTVALDPAGTPSNTEHAVYVTPEAGSKLLPAPAPKTAATLPAGEMYTIAKGDTLERLARRFYRSGAKADIARIVAANPALLKDAKTQLVVGKKLLIPTVAPKAVVSDRPAEPKAPVAKAPVMPKGPGVVIVPPGAGSGPVAKKPDAPTGKVDARIEEPKKPQTYTIAAGDTLEKIARKLMGSASRENIQKLQTLNGIKNPSSLKVGTVIKIPVMPKVAPTLAGETAGVPRPRG